jgi:4-hydroxy-tetrahydrodipicolinate reductase
MITKKAGKPAVKAAAKPVAKAGAKALQKKPIDLKSPDKSAAKPAAKTAPAAAPAPAAAAPRGPAAPATKPASAPRPAPSPAPAKTKRPTNGAVKVGVVGCAGRMGQMLLKMLINAPGIVVVGGTERRGSIALGQDIGALAGADPLGISVGDDPSLLFDTSDVVVDFTNPTATVSHAQMAARTGCALVIGTTGFDNDQLNALYRAAQRAPIVLAANMSLGINLLQQVVEEISRILDTDWDIEIVEMHHRAKIDAPSGTALALGEAAARGRG